MFEDLIDLKDPLSCGGQKIIDLTDEVKLPAAKIWNNIKNKPGVKFWEPEACAIRESIDREILANVAKAANELDKPAEKFPALKLKNGSTFEFSDTKQGELPANVTEVDCTDKVEKALFGIEKGRLHGIKAHEDFVFPTEQTDATIKESKHLNQVLDFMEYILINRFDDPLKPEELIAEMQSMIGHLVNSFKQPGPKFRQEPAPLVPFKKVYKDLGLPTKK